MPNPTDTVTAILNIAHHPSANVSNLFALASATPAFGNALSTQPNDFTLPITFKIPVLLSPGIPAVDAAGNVWFASTGIQVVYDVQELSPLGAPATFSDTFEQPDQVAIDPSGTPWVALRSGGVVDKISSNGPMPYFYNGSSNDDGHQIAIDASGNVLISDNTTVGLFELNNSGTVIGSAPFSGGTSGGLGYHDVALLSTGTVANVLNSAYIQAFNLPLTEAGPALCTYYCQPVAAPTALAVDGSGYLWALNNNSSLARFNPSYPSGGPVTGSPFSGGGLNTTTTSTSQPYPWLAIDGAGAAWVANYTGSISEFANSGVAITPAYSSAAHPGGYFASAPTCLGQGIAIDGSGDVWVSCDSASSPVLEYIGAATPVYTPITPGHFGVTP
jgi:hypothetical protein